MEQDKIRFTEIYKNIYKYNSSSQKKIWLIASENYLFDYERKVLSGELYPRYVFGNCDSNTKKNTHIDIENPFWPGREVLEEIECNLMAMLSKMFAGKYVK